MAGGSQETPQSGMNLLLGTVLLLLLLPDVAEGQDSCSGLPRGDEHGECCRAVLEQQSPGSSSPVFHLSQRCPELWHSRSRACVCLRERWLRLLQSGLHSQLAGLQTLLLNVSRAVTRDVLIAFSPTEGPSRLNSTEKGKAGKIHLPRGIFQSLSSQTVRVVVTVLNIQQLGMFKEINQTGQVLDNTVVGITVGESSISGLQERVQLTFPHGELPQGVTPRCVFWDASKGQAGGWRSSGCDTQPGDKGTVCSCDHLTFFTLLLVTIPLPAAPACALAALPEHFSGPLGVMSSHTGTIRAVLRQEPSSGWLHSKSSDGCCHRWLWSSHGLLHLHHGLLHLYQVQVQAGGHRPHQPGAAPQPRGQPAPPQPGLPAQHWARWQGPPKHLQGPGGAHPLLPALLLHLDGAGGLPALPPLCQGPGHLHPPLPGKAVPAGLGLPCSRGGSGRSSWQLWKIPHPDHGPPDHSPPVLDHFQTSSGPLHHQLWLLWPHLPLQHGCVRGGDPQELQLAGHWGSAGTQQALEGGSGGSRALLPAGSHLGPGVPHLWHLLCSCAPPLHRPQLPPRNLHIHLVGCPLLPKDKGEHWFSLLHHQT